MKTPLPTLSLLLGLSSCLVSCSEDNDFLVPAEAKIEKVSLNTDLSDKPKTLFDPEVIKIICFDGQAKYMVDNPNNENYGYNWNHNDRAIGHNDITLCLCAGTLELRITRFDDGAQRTFSFEPPSCDYLTK